MHDNWWTHHLINPKRRPAATTRSDHRMPFDSLAIFNGDPVNRMPRVSLDPPLPSKPARTAADSIDRLSAALERIADQIESTSYDSAFRETLLQLHDRCGMVRDLFARMLSEPTVEQPA